MPQKHSFAAWLRHADTQILLSSALLILLFLLANAPPLLRPSTTRTAPVLRVVLWVLLSTVIYLGAALRARRTGSANAIRIALWICFLLYLYLLLCLTLIDPGLRLTNDRFAASGVSRRSYYLEWFVNLRPFESIYTVYIRGLVKGHISLRYAFLNLLGNLCAFMPFALFLPLFSKRLKRWYFFLPTVILSVAAVEGMQFLLMVGSCDVDDLILNAGGAILLFFLLRIPPLRMLCARISSGFQK